MSMPPRPDGEPTHLLKFPLDERSNVPTVHGILCSKDKREFIGPLLTDIFAKAALNFDSEWRVEVDDFVHKIPPLVKVYNTVGSPTNINLSGAQRELLLWHWRLGVSMSWVQKLMVPLCAEDSNGMVDFMPTIIHPKFSTMLNCVIPKCAACELSRACRHSLAVMKQQAID